jgi:hypothetical protein
LCRRLHLSHLPASFASVPRPHKVLELDRVGCGGVLGQRLHRGLGRVSKTLQVSTTMIQTGKLRLSEGWPVPCMVRTTLSQLAQPLWGRTGGKMKQKWEGKLEGKGSRV